MEIEIYNSQIILEKVELRVQTALFGLRYLMREWFYTFSYFVVFNLTAAQMFVVLMIYVFKKNVSIVKIRKNIKKSSYSPVIRRKHD